MDALWAECVRFAQERTAHLWDLHRAPYTGHAPGIEVSWNGRFTSRLGDALPWPGRVGLSKPLFPLMTPKARRATMLHEIAHVYADTYHGRRCGHDRSWAAMMALLGEPPDRLSQIDDPTVFTCYKSVLALRGYQTARCPGCSKDLPTSKLLVGRMKRGETRVCHCGQLITPLWSRNNFQPIQPPEEIRA